jgi:hypothetical protein
VSTLGQWVGRWLGDWLGSVEVDPNAMSGAAMMSFSATGTISSTGSASGELVGTAMMSFSASGVLDSTGEAEVTAPAYQPGGRIRHRAAQPSDDEMFEIAMGLIFSGALECT